MRSIAVILATLLLAASVPARAGDGAATAVRLQKTLDRTAQVLERRYGEGSSEARLLVEKLRQTYESTHGVALRNPLGAPSEEERARLVTTGRGAAATPSRSVRTGPDPEDARRARERLEEMKAYAEKRWGRNSPQTKSFLALCRQCLAQRYEVDLPEVASAPNVVERTSICQQRLDALTAELRERGVSEEMLRERVRPLQIVLQRRYQVRLAGPDAKPAEEAPEPKPGAESDPDEDG